MREFLARLQDTEPARLAEFVRAVLVAVNAVGWATIPDTTVSAVVTVVSVLASLVLTKFVRSNVTPTPKPPADGNHRAN
ncbi:hypothetical protein [Amycolatopsis anabasis]|uniref:hypothetical protein n=1 Tax=Amycolatopsis anabasis TaxID=1840409 RepID=UPI00131DE1B7|nr:hypothetical protein [Amycolatopsis anabasis]